MINVERLLTELGIEYRNAGPNNVWISCINPDHIETKPSMGVHKHTGQINCFGCHLKGNLLTLLAYKGIVGVDALKYLLRFSTGGSTEEDLKKALIDFIKNRGEQSQVIQYADIELPIHVMIDSDFYLQKRGIIPEEIKKWKMAKVSQGKNLGWILIPLYQNGIIRNYFLRSTTGNGKLYGNYPRTDLLAGIDFATDYTKTLCITEGVFDTIAVQRAGFQSVACLSNRLLPGQVEVLKRYKKIVVVPDTDSMGLKLVESAGQLIYDCEVTVFSLPAGKKDAGECAVPEILQAAANVMSWSDYIIKNKIQLKIS